MNGPVLDDQTVLVADGRIVAIGDRDSTVVPSGTRVIDAAGQVLVPGLVDAHIHLRDATESDLLTYLRAGVTTAREFNGRPFLLNWRDRIHSGDLLGPTLKVAAPTLGNFSSPRDGYPTPKTAEEGRAAVARFDDAGYDWIKVYSFLSPDAFAGVLAEAERRELPVGGHVPVALGLEEAVLSSLRSIEHLTEYVDASLTDASAKFDAKDMRSIFGAGELHPQRLELWIDETVEAGIWNVPTLVWFDRILPAPIAEEAWNDPALRRQGERNRRELVRRLHLAGAPLAVGTDSDAGDDLPASAIHLELAAMVDGGLEPEDVLRIATMGGAGLLELEDEIGSVEVGKRADLLLLRCDPRERIECTAELAAVISRGRQVDLKTP